MPDDTEDEFTRRLREVTASVAGMDEEDALALLEVRIKQAEANGLARHRLSLARARGTLALALAGGAEHDIIASLQTMGSTTRSWPGTSPNCSTVTARTPSRSSARSPK